MKKVNFLCLIMLGLFFVACHSNDDTWGDWSRGYPFSGRPRTGAVKFMSVLVEMKMLRKRINI